MVINNSYIEQIHQQTIQTPELISLLAEHQLLPQLYREILITEAISSISCSLEEIEQAIEQFYQTHNLLEDSQRQEWLQARGMTLTQLVKQATRSLSVEKYKLVTWGNQLESHFIAQKSNLDQVVYSLLRTHDIGTAQEIYFRIKAGEQSFAELARQYSKGIEAQTGGLVGPVVLSQPHPQLAAKLRTCEMGELLPPMRLGEWFVIVRLEKMIPAKLDESTRRKLLDGLFQKWLNESLQSVMSQNSIMNTQILTKTNG